MKRSLSRPPGVWGVGKKTALALVKRRSKRLMQCSIRVTKKCFRKQRAVKKSRTKGTSTATVFFFAHTVVGVSATFISLLNGVACCRLPAAIQSGGVEEQNGYEKGSG